MAYNRNPILLVGFHRNQMTNDFKLVRAQIATFYNYFHLKCSYNYTILVTPGRIIRVRLPISIAMELYVDILFSERELFTSAI